MDFVKAAQIAGVMLSPTLLVGITLNGSRLLRRALNSRAEAKADPSNPPIEKVAADLRRLLLRHETLRRAPNEAMRAHRLVALEAAISDCAIDAARALGVPYPDRAAREGLPTPQLRRLLRALCDAGLVLPPWVDLLAARRHGPDPGVARS
jgi:hypothetical protein